MDTENNNTELPNYELVGDSLAETVTDQPKDIYNALTYGHYKANTQYTQGYKQFIASRFTHNNISKLGVNYALHFGDSTNITKMNDNWRSINSITDGNFYDVEYNEGNKAEVYEYAKMFSEGKLDFYSVYNDDLNELRNISDRDQSIYNAVMSGNFDNFVNTNNKDVIDRCKSFVNSVWQSATDFDNKHDDGHKKVLPIRIEMDEINEGYARKYADSNTAKYGIVYRKGSEMYNREGQLGDELNNWINDYCKEYDLKSGDDVGWIFIPADKKQFLPLILAQMYDCRSHDYTNFTNNEKELAKRNAIEEPNNINGDDESHFWYSLTRKLGLAHPEFTFDGLTNDAPGSARELYDGSIEGGLAGNESAIKSNTRRKKLEDNGVPDISDIISLSEDLYNSISTVNNKELEDESDHEYVQSTGSTMSALPQERLEALVRSGELTASVAKDILKSQVEVIHNLRNIRFTDNNYATYMENSVGAMDPMTWEQKHIMERALSKLNDNQLDLKVVSNNSMYQDKTGAYYEFTIPNSVLLETSIGSVKYKELTSDVNKLKDEEVLRLLESSPTVNIPFEGDTDTIIRNFDLKGVTKFRVPINVMDSPGQEFYNNPLVLNANELNHFGNQNARMQLLKDSYFGDLAILSDKVNGAGTKELKNFQFDFDGKAHLTNKEINDKFTTRIYNDYAEIEQLMQACRDYSPYEEIIRYYKDNYGDDWKDAIPAPYLANFVSNYARVYNCISNLTEVSDKYQDKIENRSTVFGNSSLSRFLAPVKELDEELYDDLLNLIDYIPK